MINVIKKQLGQGLVEVVVTLLIIAAVTLALIRFQANLAYSNSMAQQAGKATMLAVNQIETLRDFSTLTGSPSYQTIVSGSSTQSGTTTTYTMTWTVTTYTNPNYKVLDVAVSWPDRQGVTKSIRLISQVAGIDPAFSAAIM